MVSVPMACVHECECVCVCAHLCAYTCMCNSDSFYYIVGSWVVTKRVEAPLYFLSLFPLMWYKECNKTSKSLWSFDKHHCIISFCCSWENPINLCVCLSTGTWFSPRVPGLHGPTGFWAEAGCHHHEEEAGDPGDTAQTTQGEEETESLHFTPFFHCWTWKWS